MDAQTSYAAHGALTEPGAHAARLAGLPAEVGALCDVVQGLLIHDHYGLELYGAAPQALHGASRETLPVADRLTVLLAGSGAAGLAPRAPFQRSVGTCRDFALLLCALLRQQGRAARVRCGFANYFAPETPEERWEDHWLCEIWDAAAGAWRLADAQLDAAHRRHLAIDFDPAALPEGRFLFPWQAWQRCRSGRADPADFGHGDDRGAWFIGVNLARDLLALLKREVSPWDGWRAAKAEDRALDAAAVGAYDRLAALAKGAQGPAPPAEPDGAVRDFLAEPPWRRG